jgi:hypothetical protein
LSPNVTFPPLILVMLENNKSFSIMCLEQVLSKNHSLYSLDFYTQKLR